MLCYAISLLFKKYDTRISVMLSTGNKGPCIGISSKFHLLSLSSVFDSFGLKLSLIVILRNFSYLSNLSKLPAHENLQFCSTCIIQLLSKFEACDPT